MSEHFIKKCSCGNIIAQCRCMSCDKKVIIIEKGCNECLKNKEQTVEMISICEEDILNIKKCINRLLDVQSKLRDDYDPLEIFTLQNIIKQFEED